VRNPVSERSGFAAARTSHHQQRTLVVIHRPALGVIETRQKTHKIKLMS